MKPPDRCACSECVELDRLPERLQGIPGGWQLRLPMAKAQRRKSKTQQTR